MQQIPVTVLHVHKIKTRFLGQHRRADVVLHQFFQFAVRKHFFRRDGQPKTRIEQRVVVSQARFQHLAVGTAEAARVGQLQTDHQPFAAPRCLAMTFHQGVPQIHQPRQGFRRNHQLVGVGSPIRAHRGSLAAPHQFGPAGPKIPPAPQGQIRRIPVRLRVPTFHRQHREAIANVQTVHRQRLRQR